MTSVSIILDLSFGNGNGMTWTMGYRETGISFSVCISFRNKFSGTHLGKFREIRNVPECIKETGNFPEHDKEFRNFPKYVPETGKSSETCSGKIPECHSEIEYCFIYQNLLDKLCD